MKHAKDIGQLKAISQNLMHENICITDGIYGVLSELDIKDQITSLNERDNSDENDDLQKLMQLNKELIRKIENNYLPRNRENIEE